MKTEYAGIDYSVGQSNSDKETGIHFGVIPHASVGQAWYDSSEPVYPDWTCENCGQVNNADDTTCPCGYELPEDSYMDCDPIAWEHVDSEYTLSSDEVDIWVLKSPFYTFAQFCSPCAPGAGYLLSECENGIKTYCLGHDWFEDNHAPYTVYNVNDDTIVS